ncbi:hypothetical protein Nepgr_026282 [Nepenthes gracilis]|uniref:Bifunctional inhibitor/plant lipid transfer protein/seed storage helical domain-containing protein n=1 Tax=Nepenthes gracilis TaxID=150966 RepID=A0AAD3T8T4_NEPGR|nr:hypothetical protein Nepgr_026282 [Nepenthes gracilis]
MAGSALFRLTGAVLVCVIVGAAVQWCAEAQDGCMIVYYDMVPCFDYLSNGGSVSQDCCGGLQNVTAMVNNTASLQATCYCMINVAAINSTLAVGLPGNCSINLPYQLSPDADCSTLTYSSL